MTKRYQRKAIASKTLETGARTTTLNVANTYIRIPYNN